MSEDLLPCASIAADGYDQALGSSLSRDATFGVDPFHSEEDRNQAEDEFAVVFPDMSVIFDSVVNNNHNVFCEALFRLLTLAESYV